MEVAPDGSPLAVYLALPAEPDLSRVRSVLPIRTSVLDLGSGPGRIANPLSAAGHDVVAVDNSPEMLTHVVGAETVVGDVRSLHLNRRFGAVLALSHLVNRPDRSSRLELLRVCHEHLNDDGVVVIQRYPPDWVPTESEGGIGAVSTHLHDVVSSDDGTFSATVTYTVNDRSWSQSFTAAIVDDDELASLARANDLTVKSTIDGDQAWVVLAAQRPT